MIRKIANWFSVLTVAALTMAAIPAGAQAGYTPGPGWPNAGAQQGNPGHNGNPANTSPGAGYLSWRSPAIGGAYASSFLVDNTDFAVNNFYPPFLGGPYDFNARGSADSAPNVSGLNNYVNGWGWPGIPGPPQTPNQATGSYDPIARAFAVGTLPANYGLRTPAYFMTEVTPSAPGQFNPTVPANPNSLRYFDWNYKWNAQDPPFVDIYVNIPVGPTETTVGGYSYSAEFYVYEILYYDNLGNQQAYIQVVDTYASGTAYVQLGLLNGSTGAFPVNAPPGGVGNAVTVRLLNTVPRDPNTGLLLQLLNGQPIPPGNEAEVSQFLIYADAVQFQPAIGTIYGTPTVATMGLEDGTTRTTIATNVPTAGLVNGLYASQSIAQVIDFAYNANETNGAFPNGQFGVSKWVYSPIENGTQVVNTPPFSNTAGWTAHPPAATTAPYQGAGYLTVPTSQLPGGTDTVTYAPTLASGSYQISVFVPGNVAGQTFATQAQVQISEGTNITTVSLNESVGPAWVSIGVRAFNNNTGGTGALQVKITNYSPLAADQGTFVYANYVRFQGTSNLDVVASPIHTQAHIAMKPGGALTLKDVVIVQDEKGVIHCLDATGNGNGTTTEYWSYPSTPNTNANWFDPNTNQPKDTNPIAGGLYDGTNGNTLAEMPSGFGFSSGVVETYQGLEYLFVTSTNGRVYCISMQGRGDFNAQLNQPGTTQRVWTYPATYPSKVTVPTSSLGAFQGSASWGTTNGTPALFVPTMQGRLYCLTALPANYNNNGNSGTTTPIWTYPKLTAQALGAIAVTPVVDDFNGNAPYEMVFFGTQMLNDNPAQFIALNANTGLPVWSYNSILDPVVGVNNAFYNFVSSPCAVPATQLNAVPNDGTNPIAPTPNSDTVYTINQNNYIYAFNGETGQLLWQSSDFPYGCNGALTYAVVTTYNYLGTAQQPFPMLMIPAATTQRFYGEFARPYDANYFGGHLAWGTPFTLIGQTMTGAISNANDNTTDGNGWMYAADTGGNLYALSNTYNPALAYESNPFYPPNSPQGKAYQYAKIRIITQQEYASLAAGNVSYTAGTPPTGGDPRNPTAFDWGETAYIEVYDFPYSAESNNTGPSTTATSQPAQANITVSTQGYSGRTTTAAAQQFTSNAPTSQDGVTVLDGYAVYPYTFTPAGQSAVPPGTGTISVTLTTYQSNGAAQTVALSPANGQSPPPAPTTPPAIGWSHLPFIMANPLAIEIPPAIPNSATDPDQSIGWVHDPGSVASASIIGSPGDQQNQMNGNIGVPATGLADNPIWNQIMATPGQYVSHNSDAQVLVNVYDRSLLGLIYPPGQGLTGVRVDRHDLAWEGGQNSVWSMLPQNLFPNFEDLPNNFPNTSLDYPNISRDQISITANPTTTATNPNVGPGVTLFPPLYKGAPVSPLNNPSGDPQRAGEESGVPTPFLFQVQVPLYQPANEAYNPLQPTIMPGAGAMGDEFGGFLDQGYLGQFNVYVDSAGTGQLTLSGPSVDAYRQAQLALGITPSPAVIVVTPNVDLGGVAGGQDYGAGLGYNLFGQTKLGTVSQESPWNGSNNNSAYYGQFTVENPGNVNLLDLRVAKGSSVMNNAGNLFDSTWTVPAANNDPAGYLDAYFDVWSDMDAADAPLNPNNPQDNYVILPKPRPTDLVPTQLSVDPVARVNFNLGITSPTPLEPNYPTGALGGANIGVTVPFGMPVGIYSQTMRVIENWPYYNPTFSNEFLDQTGPTSYETYSDPTFNLSFTVEETRLTGNSTLVNYLSPPALENITTGQSALAFRNVQPAAMRDPFGGLITAWASDRPGFVPGFGPSPVPNPAYRLYFAGLGNQAQFAGQSAAPPSGAPASPFSSLSPLFDLDWWTPATQGSWLNPSQSSLNGYPAGSIAALAALFPNAPAGQTVNNVSFGSPAFPADGMVDKLGLSGSSVYSQAIMGFVGEAQLSGNGVGAANAATGGALSGLYLAPVQSTAGKAAVTVGNPVLVATDYSIQKGKPAILQRSNTSALVFYPGTSANASEIYYTLFNGATATPPYPLNFGGGFQSVDSVSVLTRFLNDQNSGPLIDPIVEMTFGGKLRGTKADQIYMGRLALTKNGTQLAVDQNGNPLPFMDLAPVSFEQLSASTDAGVYQSTGIEYDTTQPIHVVQFTQSLSAQNSYGCTNLLIDGWGDPNFNDPNGPWNPAVNYTPAKNTMAVDRATGIISYDTRLGGKVYINPSLGTVKFVGGMPSAAAVVKMSYTPAFTRISDAAGAYSSPSGLFDTRVTSDPLDLNNGSAAASFVWRVADSGSNTYGDDWVTLQQIQNGNQPYFVENDRYVYTYNRGATGAGQATRPYMTTRRFGLNLRYPIYVAPNGVPGYVQVQWLLPTGWGDPPGPHYYQIDPVNGKIYFGAEDEGSFVRVIYDAANPTTGQLFGRIGAGGNAPEYDTVSQIEESPESPVLMSNAVNESGLDTFLDPFDYFSLRRPPLTWLFWTSTRNGTPDVYFETISPMLIPRPNGLNQ